MNNQEQEKTNTEDANAPMLVITENEEKEASKEYPNDVRVLIGDNGDMKIFDFEKLGSFACHPTTLYKAFVEWESGQTRVKA